MGAARRLRVLAGSLAGGASSSPSAAQITEDGASITELDAPALLSDADVKQFLVDGCLALPMTDLPVGFHRELQAKSRAGFESLRAEGITEDRYVYEQLPAMSDILSSPVLRGALISLLGEGYVQHPHRSMHVQGDIEDEEPRLGDGGWCRPNRRVLERWRRSSWRRCLQAQGRSPRADAAPLPALDHRVLLSLPVHARHGAQ